MINIQQMLMNIMSNNKFMQNPRFKNGVEMFMNGDRNGALELAENIAKANGTTVEEMRKKLGV